MGIEGKTILITDGDNRMGMELGRQLMGRNCNLAVNVNGSGECAWIEGYPRALTLSFDAASPEAVNQAVHQIVRRFGALHVLIHSHNRILCSPIEETKEEEFLDVLNDNAKSAFFCTQASAREMIKQGEGKILYLSSIHDEKPTGCAFAYSVSKGAVSMLCREAALDLGKYNIQVNLLEIGPVPEDPDRYQSRYSYIYEDCLKKIPDGKYCTQAGAAEFAVSVLEERTGCLNGECIRLDRGYLLHYVERPDEEAVK